MHVSTKHLQRMLFPTARSPTVWPREVSTVWPSAGPRSSHWKVNQQQLKACSQSLLAPQSIECEKLGACVLWSFTSDMQSLQSYIILLCIFGGRNKEGRRGRGKTGQSGCYHFNIWKILNQHITTNQHTQGSGAWMPLNSCSLLLGAGCRHLLGSNLFPLPNSSLISTWYALL